MRERERERERERKRGGGGGKGVFFNIYFFNSRKREVYCFCVKCVKANAFDNEDTVVEKGTRSNKGYTKHTLYKEHTNKYVLDKAYRQSTEAVQPHIIYVQTLNQILYLNGEINMDKIDR